MSLVADGHACPERSEGSATWLLDVAVQQEHILYEQEHILYEGGDDRGCGFPGRQLPV
mgnify:CR=1 FL=1